VFEVISAESGSVGEAAAAIESEGRCPVCHSAEVAFDAVERGPQVWMQLAECGHCDHRWTLPEPARSVRGVVRAVEGAGRAVSREGARAA